MNTRTQPGNKSQVITSLKVFAALCVILVHAGLLSRYTDIPDTNALVFALKVGDIISRLGVPLFFLISGYLLFRKPVRWMENMKKKVKSLAIPYVFWVVVWGIVEVICIRLGLQQQVYDLSDGIGAWLGFFVGVPFYNAPKAYDAFWFIRDLFILNILATPLQWMIKRSPKLCAALAIAVWLLPSPAPYSGCQAAFFLLGGVLANKPDWITWLRALPWWVTVPSCLITCCMPFIFDGYIFIRLYIPFTILLACQCAQALQQNPFQNAVTNFLSAHVFFLYAFHTKVIAGMQMIACKLLPQTSVVIAVEYIGLWALVILMGVGISWAFEKIMPRFYRVVTGGR